MRSMPVRALRAKVEWWLLLVLAVIGAVAACGGSSSPAAAPTQEPARTTAPDTPGPPATQPPETESPTAPPAPEPAQEGQPEKPTATPLPGLPRFTAGYEDWLKLNEDPIPPREGGDPHSSTKNVYASQQAIRTGGSLEYPVGTVIVKEGVRPDTDFIGLIATMRKARGADPDHNNWIFVEWVRSSPDAPFEEIGRDATCWVCHSDAADTDYVWVHTLGVAPP